MPTTIIMEDLSGNSVHLTTAEYAERRGDESLRFPNGCADTAFQHFEDPPTMTDATKSPFVADVKHMLEAGEGWKGPSFESFKNCVLRGALFGIITARAHTEAGLRQGVITLLELTLTDQEWDMVHANLCRWMKLARMPAIQDRTEAFTWYLDRCAFAGVSSVEFRDKFHIAGSACSPEQAKKVAIHDFVQRTLDGIHRSFEEEGRTIASISFGMSDDDLGNLAELEKYMGTELQQEFPHVQFSLFDASQECLRKMPLNLDTAVPL